MVALSNQQQPAGQVQEVDWADGTLEDTALEYLAVVPNAVIVYGLAEEGGYYGFEVWTPDQGHIVTVLEV